MNQLEEYRKIFCDQWHDDDYDCTDCKMGVKLADGILSQQRQSLKAEIEKLRETPKVKTYERNAIKGGINRRKHEGYFEALKDVCALLDKLGGKEL